MEKNCVDPAQLSKIDIMAEFDRDLSYNEAVELALHKFPSHDVEFWHFRELQG